MSLDACESPEESRECFHALFASMTDLVAIVDLGGRLRKVNQPIVWERLFGEPPVEGTPLCDPPGRGELAVLVAPLLKESLEAGCGEVRSEVLSANEQRLLVRIHPFALGVMVSLRDDSIHVRTEEERRLAESRLRQAQKMEAIGTLAGGIAHDFNNILWVIAGNNELAMLGLPTAHPIRRHLLRIEQACGRAQDLVRQILSFSRQGEQERQPLQISTIVKESLKLLRPSLPAGIEIGSEISEDAGTVMADLSQINQVLMALYSNASDAMREEGGQLEVRLERRHLAAETAGPLAGLDSGEYVVLTVADSGVGIAPADMERIFDPFFTTKPVDRGTGLGLSVAHGILRSHGGAIRAESAPGQGTLFQVFLPLLASAEAVPAEAFDSLPRGKERILFIDDNQAVLEVGTEMLARLGYRVTSRHNPEEALALFRADPSAFDLVLTDQTMPQLTGDRLAVAAIALRPELPVIMCTGHSERISADAVSRIGVRAILTKPLTAASLARTLRQALD